MASPGSLRPGQGPVELTGTARIATQSFTSPLTEQECVAYRFEKEAHARDTAGGVSDQVRTKSWQTIHVEEAGAPFFLEAEGERVLVDGSTANLDVERSYTVATDDFEEGIGDKILAAVTNEGAGVSDEEREVADEFVEEIRSGEHERRYTEWVVPHGEPVSVRGEAVDPSSVPIASSLDAGIDGPTEPVRDGLTGTILGVFGAEDAVPADPRARYKPRAIERLPETDSAADGEHGEREREVRETVSLFEGVPEGGLAENPDAIQHLVNEAGSMTDEEIRIANEALPDVPAVERARVVISWGSGDSEFVVTDRA